MFKTLIYDLRVNVYGHKLSIFLNYKHFQGNREELTEVNEREARSDAEALYNAGEKIWGTDESEFNRILVTKDIKHLRVVFAHYQHLTSKDIEASIKSEFSGSIRMGLLALGTYIVNSKLIFAHTTYKLNICFVFL